MNRFLGPVFHPPGEVAPAVSVAELKSRYRELEKKDRINLREKGRVLIALKKQCKHGEWMPTLDDLEINDRTARDQMAYARKTVTVADSELPSLREALGRNVDDDEIAPLEMVEWLEEVDPLSEITDSLDDRRHLLVFGSFLRDVPISQWPATLMLNHPRLHLHGSPITCGMLAIYYYDRTMELNQRAQAA